MFNHVEDTSVSYLKLEKKLVGSSKEGNGIGALIINFNTSKQTLRCINSLYLSTMRPDWILVLDNASAQEDFFSLMESAEQPELGELRIYRSPENVGFARGSNLLIEEMLSEKKCRQILLINNDAVAEKDMVSEMSSHLQLAGEKVGALGGRMHKLSDPWKVDTLGISIYSSLMPADRLQLCDKFFGPTGGCCIFSREFIECIKAKSGYFYDPRFFCYCEDTDLSWRAILLGYRPMYLDSLCALHEGQASSQRDGYSEFIAYHGLRNIMWMHMKLMPRSLLTRYGFLLLFAHISLIIRHALRGRPFLVFRVYRDAFIRAPEFLEERKFWKEAMRGNSDAIMSVMSTGFYRKGYLVHLWREFWGTSKA